LLQDGFSCGVKTKVCCHVTLFKNCEWTERIEAGLFLNETQKSITWMINKKRGGDAEIGLDERKESKYRIPSYQVKL
jgi:hypothetical protein